MIDQLGPLAELYERDQRSAAKAVGYLAAGVGSLAVIRWSALWVGERIAGWCAVNEPTEKDVYDPDQFVCTPEQGQQTDRLLMFLIGFLCGAVLGWLCGVWA